MKVKVYAGSHQRALSKWKEGRFEEEQIGTLFVLVGPVVGPQGGGGGVRRSQARIYTQCPSDFFYPPICLLNIINIIQCIRNFPANLLCVCLFWQCTMSDSPDRLFSVRSQSR
jgi:hypothetical protein